MSDEKSGLSTETASTVKITLPEEEDEDRDSQDSPTTGDQTNG
ncbi:hypothetical protein [Salinibacter phage 4_17]